MKKITAITLIIFSTLLALNAVAGSDSGLYIGASVGTTGLDIGSNNFNLDEDASGYKILVGYNFGLVPSIDLAVEADYRDFGSFENNVLNYSSDMTSIDVYGLLGTNIGPVGVFGKLGYSNGDSETNFGNLSFSDSDSSTTYGLGAKIALGSLSIRAEYEVFDADNIDDLTMISAGLVYTY